MVVIIVCKNYIIVSRFVNGAATVLLVSASAQKKLVTLPIRVKDRNVALPVQITVLRKCARLPAVLLARKCLPVCGHARFSEQVCCADIAGLLKQNYMLEVITSVKIIWMYNNIYDNTMRPYSNNNKIISMLILLVITVVTIQYIYNKTVYN